MKELRDDLTFLIDQRIRTICKEILEEQSSRSAHATSDSESRQISERLQLIMSKEFISIKEVALLMNCSDGHIRNLVAKAQKGKASCPIPFLDLDGVTVFPRLKLMEWAARPKQKLRAVS